MSSHPQRPFEPTPEASAAPQIVPPVSAPSSFRHRIARLLTPLARRAASSYIAGGELSDALRVAHALASRRRTASIAFWDETGTSPAAVFEATRRAAFALATDKLDCYLSVKAPSLSYSAPWFTTLIDICRCNETRLHFDSLGTDSATPTRSLVEQLLPLYSNLSVTLPGRWLRSISDADWAISRQLAIRVVQGQWEDPAAPRRDPYLGYLEVVARLAGRARRVAVATHNPTLARISFERLQRSGTPCELELLFGLPTRAVLEVARERKIPVRVYVPYGYGWLPYSLSQARRHPKILWWMLRDALSPRGGELL